VLVADVGGGTTDFTLIEVGEEGGNLALTRLAVGDHLLLGGDNMDLTLAHHAAQALAAKGTKLDAGQMLQLTYACRNAKEEIFARPKLEKAPVTVLGKGRRPRAVAIGDRTAEAVRRYMRARQRHRDAALPNLWLGSQGALTRWGIKFLIERRAEMAGVEHANPHRFRHTFAHRWLADGNGETDLMRLAGWRSRQMLSRYAASASGGSLARSVNCRKKCWR